MCMCARVCVRVPLGRVPSICPPPRSHCGTLAVVHILLCGAFPHAVRQPRRHHLRSMRFGPDFRLPVWGTLSSHARQFCRALLESDVARRPLVAGGRLLRAIAGQCQPWGGQR